MWVDAHPANAILPVICSLSDGEFIAIPTRRGTKSWICRRILSTAMAVAASTCFPSPRALRKRSTPNQKHRLSEARSLDYAGEQVVAAADKGIKGRLRYRTHSFYV